MATIVTFCILAAAGVVLWWLLRDVLAGGEAARGPKCPACGSLRTRPIGGARRCASCGTQFRPHVAWHVHEPTLPAVSVVLLAFLALLGFALSDLVFGWRIVGEAQATLIAMAAAGGIAAAVGCFLKHRKEYGRN
jgi:uncharacterized paraquat-inducible protein A